MFTHLTALEIWQRKITVILFVMSVLELSRQKEKDTYPVLKTLPFRSQCTHTHTPHPPSPSSNPFGLHWSGTKTAVGITLAADFRLEHTQWRRSQTTIPGAAADGESVPFYKSIWSTNVIHQVPVKHRSKELELLHIFWESSDFLDIMKKLAFSEMQNQAQTKLSGWNTKEKPRKSILWRDEHKVIPPKKKKREHWNAKYPTDSSM